jgi:hypothetical protein
VIDLPELPDGQYFEVWPSKKPKADRPFGLLKPPLRFDSLYAMEPTISYSSLQINSVDQSRINR